MNTAIQDITSLIANFLGTTPEALAAHIAHKQEQARKRVASNNRRYEAALSKMTDVQALVIEKLEQEGHKMSSRIWQSRKTGDIACMLSKQVWNGAKSRMGTKLVMVYPDGRRAETFERTISIRQDF